MSQAGANATSTASSNIITPIVQWTPSLIGSSVAGTAVYSVANAQYIQLGKFVCLWCQLTWTGGTGSGDMQISGFPLVGSLAYQNSLVPGAGYLTSIDFPLGETSATWSLLRNESIIRVVVYGDNEVAVFQPYSATGAMVFSMCVLVQ